MFIDIDAFLLIHIINKYIYTLTVVYMKQDGCCSSFKWEIDDPSSGQSITVARHGTAADEDELWAELPCDLDEKVNSKINK